MSIWDDIEFLNRMEAVRESLRGQGKRLTFDCLNLRFKKNRAYCSKGRHISPSRNRTISLKIVLQGITSRVCGNCELFSTEESGWMSM